MDEWSNIYVIAEKSRIQPENASMVASNSFKELSEVLAQLESAGTTVQHAEMDQELLNTESEVTAELAVTVPILTDDDMRESVSIDATNAAIEDGEVAVDLTVTVSTDGSKRTAHAGTPPETPATTGGQSDAETDPTYKNPDALRAVYEQYSSFPKMTEALGVDVTSETVRRHMIKYGIHDPNDTRPKSYMAAKTPDQTDDHTDTDKSHNPATASTETTATEETDPKTSVVTTDGHTDTSSGVSDEVATQEPTSAITDGGNIPVDCPTEQPQFATMQVRDVLAESATQQYGDPTVSSDIEFPETLTVAELADAINQSQTLHEVTQHIGVDRSTVKQFLQEFDLIDFVSHRLAADQITVSPNEVVRRITAVGQ